MMKQCWSEDQKCICEGRNVPVHTAVHKAEAGHRSWARQVGADNAMQALRHERGVYLFRGLLQSFDWV